MTSPADTPAGEPASARRKPGPKPRPPELRRGNTPMRGMRLDDARWNKLRALGMSWLRDRIDRARLPDSAPRE
jgi:hypothetical protein